MAAGEITLQAKMAEAPLSIAEAKRIASGIAEALETAHRKGLVHRNLKTSNIVLTTDGHVNVLGFDLASENDDPRADILSLGEILREMLAGTPEVPELLEHVVRKMCAVRPEDRYQLVHEVLTDLEHVEVEAPSIAETPRGRKLPLSLIAVAALAVLAGLVWWMLPSSGTLSGGDLSSVAVLPLRNVSQDPMESDYLAAGISEALITRLAQVGLQVTPWETARRYTDTSKRGEAIARELNVDAVLSGKFQLVDERIVTTFTLVEARSGFVTWAEEFEEPFEDLFRMQRRIAMGAASSLKRKLTGEEEEALATPESRSVDAYDLYLQGAHVLQDGTEEATNLAFEYFTRAIELDAGLEEAHVGLGAVHSARYWFGWEGGSDNLDRAKEHYERALALNPANLRARRGLVNVNFYGGNSEACLIQGRETERLARADDVQALLTRGLAYHFGGLGDRSLPLFRRVIEIDPLNQEAYFHLAFASFWAGAFQEAIDVGTLYVARFGDDQEVHAHVAASYQRVDNPKQARAHYEKAIEVGSLSLAPYPFLWAGYFFVDLGSREQAAKAWRRGAELVESRLSDYPEHAEMHLYLAEFYRLLGDRESSDREERLGLESSAHSVFAFCYLAAAHAHMGDYETAVALLRRNVRQGRLTHFWKRIFEIAAPTSLESEAFPPFLEEYEAEVQRLRATY